MLRQQPPALRPLFSLHSWLGGRAGTLVWMPRPLGMDTVEVRPPSARHGRAHAPEAAGARVSVSTGSDRPRRVLPLTGSAEPSQLP